MKKIDLHIHTVCNKYLDEDFIYDSDKMKTYISSNKFDVIAITNHNLFDLKNFIQIKNDLKDMRVVVYPGIEISLENGHILVICDDNEESYTTLGNITTEISKNEKNDMYKMNIVDFNRLCVNKGFLLIPHYIKGPVLGEEYIKKIEEKVKIGEVGSPKNFFKMKKNDDLVPVYFSDIRIGREDIESYKFNSRYTYLNCENVDFSTLKRTLEDKRFVDLNKEGLEEEFEILDGKARASTGINVLIGKRSSGKTYTLNSIYNHNSNSSLYIKQFEITEKCSDEEFSKVIKNSEQETVSEYLKEFIEILDYVDTIYNNIKVGDYINTLRQYAQQSINDLFSRLSLFNYLEIDSKDEKEINKIKSAVEVLLDSSQEYSTIIFSHIDKEKMIDVYNVFINKLKEISKYNKCVSIANDISKKISDELGKKTPVIQVTTCDLRDCFRLEYVKFKFNNLIKSIKRTLIVEKEILSKFKKQVFVYRNSNKTKIKSNLGVTKNGNVDYLINKLPFDAYLEAKNDDNITNKTGVMRYKLFFDYEVRIVNEINNAISGGQKAEYMLLNKLVNYKMYDYVILDEMEASFDNPFLNNEIIDLLNQISKKCTIFISTHNNNLGVSLKPDYYIYHTINNQDDGFIYSRYCGKSNEKELFNDNNESVWLANVLIDTMEASKVAYDERGTKYESIINE